MNIPEDDSDSEEINSEDERNDCFPPKNRIQAFEYLASVWEELNPPVPENQLIGKLVGVVYYSDDRKPHFFIGKILARKLNEQTKSAEAFTIDCMKRASTSTATILEETPPHLEKDI